MPGKPNLLFIFTDEQRFDTMGCYGNDWIHTPNLNRLSDQSFVFDNAYVSQTVCTPSRSTIMTGLYPHTNGCVANNVPLRPETRTIAEMLDERYLCGYYGKWHLGDEVVAQHGFEKWVSIEDMYRGFYSKEEYLSIMSDYHHFLVDSGFVPNGQSHGAEVFGRSRAAKLPEQFTKASFLGQSAARFIRENRGRPFAMYVNFLEPHLPFTGPCDDLYDPSSIPVGPGFRTPPPENASLLHRRKAEEFLNCQSRWDVDLSSEQGWRELRGRYMGLVTLVDKAVGVILAALEQAGLADDTIVVFTSDHGDMMGDHAIFTKTVMYEEAMKVPLLVRVPRLGKKQQRIGGRMSQADLVPTLLDLMDQPIPSHLQGQSRASVLRGNQTLEENDVFVEWNGRDARGELTTEDDPNDERECLDGAWRSVISHEGWKLNLSPVDQCELYDLNADPPEMNNLFDDSKWKDRVRELGRRITRWQERTGDTCELPRL